MPTVSSATNLPSGPNGGIFYSHALGDDVFANSLYSRFVRGT